MMPAQVKLKNLCTLPGFHQRAVLALMTGCLLGTGGIAYAADTAYSPYADRDYPTELLFGETHVHSALAAIA